MRKLLFFALTAALLFGLTACFGGSEDNPTMPQDTTLAYTTESPSAQTTTETQNSSATKVPSQSPLPVYVPGSIKLEPGGIGGDFEFTPTKRRLYYSIPGPFSALAPGGTLDELFEKDKDIYSEPQEMALVTLVKHCNISRQDFNKAVDEYIKMCASAGFDMSEEQFEIPNADIIYSLDNAIINEYYRRR